MDNGSWLADDAGLLTRQELLRRGVLPEDISKAVRRRQLVALQRGVYLSTARKPSPWQAGRAAVLGGGIPHAVVSHATAARIHHIEVPPGGPEHLTVSRALRPHNRDRLRWHTTRCAPADVVCIDGLPVTAVARTLVDVCRMLPRLPAVWTIDDALGTGLVTVDEIRAATRRLTLAPGIRQFLRLLALTDPRAQSPLETQARLILVRAGLPQPEAQLRVTTPSGRHVYLDLAYPRSRVAIELDGRGTHDVPEALYRDRTRQNELLLCGWLVLRFTWYDVMREPERMVAAVRNALLARAS